MCRAEKLLEMSNRPPQQPEQGTHPAPSRLPSLLYVQSALHPRAQLAASASRPSQPATRALPMVCKQEKPTAACSGHCHPSSTPPSLIPAAAVQELSAIMLGCLWQAKPSELSTWAHCAGQLHTVLAPGQLQALLAWLCRHEPPPPGGGALPQVYMQRFSSGELVSTAAAVSAFLGAAAATGSPLPCSSQAPFFDALDSVLGMRLGIATGVDACALPHPLQLTPAHMGRLLGVLRTVPVPGPFPLSGDTLDALVGHLLRHGRAYDAQSLPPLLAFLAATTDQVSRNASPPPPELLAAAARRAAELLEEGSLTLGGLSCIVHASSVLWLEEPALLCALGPAVTASLSTRNYITEAACSAQVGDKHRTPVGSRCDEEAATKCLSSTPSNHDCTLLPQTCPPGSCNARLRRGGAVRQRPAGRSGHARGGAECAVSAGALRGRQRGTARAGTHARLQLAGGQLDGNCRGYDGADPRRAPASLPPDSDAASCRQRVIWCSLPLLCRHLASAHQTSMYLKLRALQRKMRRWLVPANCAPGREQLFLDSAEPLKYSVVLIFLPALAPSNAPDQQQKFRCREV